VKGLLLIGAALLTASCATLDDQPDYLFGLWGGPHVGIVFEGGLANVEFDCASGTIDQPVYPAADGAFTAKGTFRAGTGGPVQVGQIFRSQKVTYSGRVVKDVMTLNLTLQDGDAGGPFTLQQGAPPQLTRCL
jgi:hypothetical protein